MIILSCFQKIVLDVEQESSKALQNITSFGVQKDLNIYVVFKKYTDMTGSCSRTGRKDILNFSPRTNRVSLKWSRGQK